MPSVQSVMTLTFSEILSQVKKHTVSYIIPEVNDSPSHEYDCCSKGKSF